MKRIFGVIISLLLVLIAVNVFAAPPSSDYQLLFADEFEGDALNRDVWAYRTNTKTGGVNVPENVRIEDGMMYIDYKKVGDTYTCGGVISKFSFPYGYYETRAKVYGGTGALHTSFWLHGFSESSETVADVPQRANTVEIDGFEINSHNSTDLSHGTYYNWAETIGRFRNHYTEQDWSKDYFVMGIEWLPDRVNFYVNDVLVSTDEDFGVYGPSYMWLTALAQPENREHLIDDSLLPGYSEFDYYRYYQMPIKGLNLMGNGHFEYDRANNSDFPRCFVIKGDTNASRVCSTYDAYEGAQCMVQGSHEPYDAFAGQRFCHLVEGDYTFSGMFKTSDGLSKARIVVYGEDGSVIAEKNIPSSNEWIKVSIEDIDIEGYAYVAVESASDGGTSLLADNLEFYIQDGVEYTKTTEPDYMLYNSYPSKTASAFYSKQLVDFADAKTVTGEWIKSSLKSGSYYAYYDENNSIEWEITADETATYSLDVYALEHNGNMEKQKYTVYINDGEGTDYLIQTGGIKEDWYSAGSFNAEKGDKIRIKLSSGSNSGFIRVYQLRILTDYVREMYLTPIFKLNDARVGHKAYIHFEDNNRKALKTYEENGEYYLPFGMVKDRIGLNITAEDGAEYITATELKNQTGYETVRVSEYLYLTDGDFVLSEQALAYLIYDMQNSMDTYKMKSAEALAPETEVEAIDYGMDDAFKVGTWKFTSVSGDSYYATGSCKAVWTDTVEESGNYKLQFRSAVHENSSTAVKTTVYVKNDSNSYIFNEKTGTAGWYDLGTYKFEEGESFTLVLENHEKSGYLRVGGVRLIPLPEGMTLTQNGKNVTVNILRFAQGTIGKLLLAEYRDNGSLLKVHIEDASATVPFTLENENSFYKIMLWKDFEIMQPFCRDITN